MSSSTITHLNINDNWLHMKQNHEYKVDAKPDYVNNKEESRKKESSWEAPRKSLQSVDNIKTTVKRTTNSEYPQLLSSFRNNLAVGRKQELAKINQPMKKGASPIDGKRKSLALPLQDKIALKTDILQPKRKSFAFPQEKSKPDLSTKRKSVVSSQEDDEMEKIMSPKPDLVNKRKSLAPQQTQDRASPKPYLSLKRKSLVPQPPEQPKPNLTTRRKSTAHQDRTSPKPDLISKRKSVSSIPPDLTVRRKSLGQVPKPNLTIKRKSVGPIQDKTLTKPNLITKRKSLGAALENGKTSPKPEIKRKSLVPQLERASPKPGIFSKRKSLLPLEGSHKPDTIPNRKSLVPHDRSSPNQAKPKRKSHVPRERTVSNNTAERPVPTHMKADLHRRHSLAASLNRTSPRARKEETRSVSQKSQLNVHNSRSTSCADKKKKPEIAETVLSRRMSRTENLKDGLPACPQPEKPIRRKSIVRQDPKQEAKQDLKKEARKPRKRGTTLPGSLAKPPPPVQNVQLPPMKVEPIQLNMPKISKPKTTNSTRLSVSNKTTPIQPYSPSSSQEKPKTSLSTRKMKGLSLGSGTRPDFNRENRRSSMVEVKRLVEPDERPKPIETDIPEIQGQSGQMAKLFEQLQELVAKHPVEPKSTLSKPRGIPAKLRDWNHGMDQVLSPFAIPKIPKYNRHELNLFEKTEIVKYPEVYFTGARDTKKIQGKVDNPELNHGYDDIKGNYLTVIGDHLGYRYEVLERLGEGSFGQVVKCLDHKTNEIVAVKLIRNIKRVYAQAKSEVKILNELVKWDPQDHHHNVKMTDHFTFRNHLCIACECLSMNLFEFIKINNFQGFHLPLIKRFTIQLLRSLTMLSEHGLIHCDLKPENILLKHPNKSTIKVIDFGSSCFENQKVYTYIQSRFYRAPEIVLGLDYTKAIDMWSVGCIVAELYSGSPLFPGKNERDQLGCIMEVMGMPDSRLIEMSDRKQIFFDQSGEPKTRRQVGSSSLSQAVKCNDPLFLNFIKRCLEWNPSKRLTPKQAFEHKWILQSK